MFISGVSSTHKAPCSSQEKTVLGLQRCRSQGPAEGARTLREHSCWDRGGGSEGAALPAGIATSVTASILGPDSQHSLLTWSPQVTLLPARPPPTLLHHSSGGPAAERAPG